MNIGMLTTDIMLTVQENNKCLKPGKEINVYLHLVSLYLYHNNKMDSSRKKVFLGSKSDKVGFNFPLKI